MTQESEQEQNVQIFGREKNLSSLPSELKAQLRTDARLYGNGYAEEMPDGSWRRIDPAKLVISFYLRSPTEPLGSPALKVKSVE